MCVCVCVCVLELYAICVCIINAYNVFLPGFGQKLSARKYVFLLTNGFPKGRIGEIKVQHSSEQVIYSLSGAPAELEIDVGDGKIKLSLLKDLPKIASAPFKIIKFAINAGPNDQSSERIANVSIIILPSNYGDKTALGFLREINIIVHSEITSHKKGENVSAFSLFHFLRSLNNEDRTKNLSIAELKIEKTVELTKNSIKQYFRKLLFISI